MSSIRVTIFLLGLMIAGMGLVLAQNLPTAPSNLNQEGSDTFNINNYDSQSHEAIAGNITSLTIHAIGQTKSWQGYYGNITATITLDDSGNNTFYNWTAAEPRGQIYATLNTSLAWASVQCFNFTTTDFANETTIENYYTIATDDVDGVSETYNMTDHPSFEVGSQTLTGCPTTYIFQSDEPQQQNFVNVMLFDSTLNDTGWIYTTLIENRTPGSNNDLACYNGAPCDFQIFVNEDGHGTDTSTTTMFFWVEIV